MAQPAVSLEAFELATFAEGYLPGREVLRRLLEAGERLIADLHRWSRGRPIAAYGRVRGTGPGLSFGRWASSLEADHPLPLVSPFEGSDRVAGAAWVASEILGTGHSGSLARLRWSSGADDLPMHVHDHSDRCIFVLEGRGFFHVSNQSCERFTGEGIRTIAARERDVFLFSRGVVHTFSTTDHPMTLLSCQLPYLPFDDPRQYRLPAKHWTARHDFDRSRSAITIDHGWSVLAAQERMGLSIEEFFAHPLA